MDILQYLVSKKVLSKERADKIRAESADQEVPVLDLLKKDGKISEGIILDALSEVFRIPIKKVNTKNISEDILAYIPQESAGLYKFVPIGISDGALEVGVTNPDDIESRDALNFISSKTGTPYKIFLISEADFKAIFEKYEGMSLEVTKALSEISTDEIEQEQTQASSEVAENEELIKNIETKDVKKSAEEVRIIEDAPVTKIVATILRYAIEGSASDVHIEHMRENIRVRFRVDGVLNTSLVLPREVYSAVVARIKILSNMKLDEKRRPQDGRFSAKIDGRKIDFRVSTFPTYFGEKVVMRILDQGKGVKKLDELGLSQKNLEAIKRALGRSYGIILISGPTGSGKTTTLYSMLQEINGEERNILSLEDPVEYNIEGVNQSQVRPEIGYTFANGLRTTLRQDPDIIMVGEIRDKETAQLAIQAALTGHLVFSTIHTNNAFGVIPRLIDMGVDPYLISPTLVLAIAQRLVRQRCPDAGNPIPIEGSMKMMIEKEFESLPAESRKEINLTGTVYNTASTAECPNGTRGRIAVMELIEMNKDLETAILENPTEQHITDITRKQGYLTMKQDAILKALKGDIPFEEVNSL